MSRFSDHSGFSLVEICAVLLLVGLMGAAGVVLYKNHSKNSTQPAVASAPATSPLETGPAAPTANWVTYTSASGKFTLKYPKSWATAAHPELCGDGVFLLGATSDSVGTCASENFGQMGITWQADGSNCGDLPSDLWTQTAKETATVAGLKATKITATAKTQDAVVGAYAQGTLTVQYCFAANGITYTAAYFQLPNYPNALDDFNIMLTKTFKIN